MSRYNRSFKSLNGLPTILHLQNSIIIELLFEFNWKISTVYLLTGKTADKTNRMVDDTKQEKFLEFICEENHFVYK